MRINLWGLTCFVKCTLDSTRRNASGLRVEQLIATM